MRLRDTTPEMVETFAFLKEYFKDWGHAPTQEEIAEEFSISRQAAAKRLFSLEKRQVIYVKDGQHRGITMLKQSFPENGY